MPPKRRFRPPKTREHSKGYKARNRVGVQGFLRVADIKEKQRPFTRAMFLQARLCLNSVATQERVCEMNMKHQWHYIMLHFHLHACDNDKLKSIARVRT